jgi:hypothetical protein
MIILTKILGNFRWLFLLIGIAVTALVAAAFWPSDKPQEPISHETVTVTDSSGIMALRDSLTMLRTHSQGTRIIRVTFKDSLKGTSTIYLDSGSVVQDAESVTRVIRDTVAVHIKDSVYVKKEFAAQAKKWNVDAGAFVSHDASLSGAADYGLSAGVRYKVIGPIFIGGTVDKKGLDNLPNGWEIKALAGFEF